MSGGTPADAWATFSIGVAYGAISVFAVLAIATVYTIGFEIRPVSPTSATFVLIIQRTVWGMLSLSVAAALVSIAPQFRDSALSFASRGDH